MIKLKEAQKVGSTSKDVLGRTVANTDIIYRDLFVNPDHIISINEEYSSDPEVKLSRLETIRGSFVVVGTATEVQKSLYSGKKMLKD